MSFSLKIIEEIIDEEEISIWKLVKNNGEMVINISKLFDDSVCECSWLDNKHQFIQVMYSNWDSSELFAIINTNGIIIRNAIRSIEKYIDKLQLFILEMSGAGLTENAIEYDLAPDDWKMAVVNRYGKLIITPEYLKIYYDDEENIIYADNFNGKKIKFNINGKKIN